jgi:hypothetical protein
MGKRLREQSFDAVCVAVIRLNVIHSPNQIQVRISQYIAIMHTFDIPQGEISNETS